ncbi:MAG: DNA-binding helix-hairpin-helix protein with protein kinase domain [Limisphaerales bacterium]
MRRLHFAGLAHSDLSHNNVLIDPKHGDACVIDIDSLVVPGLAPPSVLGTPGYIAPEVVVGDALPSIETDLHALAVLIYETLLLRHPLQGPKIHAKSPEQDELLSMGKNALYIEHPTDRSNHLKQAPDIPVSRLGPHLEALFHKTFVEGLHNPPMRATASQWEKALTKTLDLIHPSPNGKQWFIVARDMSKQCPYTKRDWAAPIPIMDLFREKGGGAYSDEQHTITVWNNRYLYKWHLFSNLSPQQAERDPQAYFSYYQDKWWMVNQSGHDMIIVDEEEYLRDGHAVEITEGLKVLMSPEDSGRLAIFDFL